MTVDTPTCKLCGWTASSAEVNEFGPQVFEHWQSVHPEVWAEFAPLLDQMKRWKQQNPDFSDQSLDWFSRKSKDQGQYRTSQLTQLFQPEENT